MKRKQKIIISVVIVAVLLIVIITVLWGGSHGTPGSAGTAPSASGVPPAGFSTTRVPVPAGSVAPNEGAPAAPQGVAVPAVQVAAAPGSASSYRGFTMTIKNGAYTPSTVIVNQGDTVDLQITAVDGDYGFTQPDYGLNSSIAQGKTQPIQFQALQPGKFTFYCGSCGGPAKGPVGYLIVTAKS